MHLETLQKEKEEFTQQYYYNKNKHSYESVENWCPNRLNDQVQSIQTVWIVLKKNNEINIYL